MANPLPPAFGQGNPHPPLPPPEAWGSKWLASFWKPPTCGSCLESCFCPCVLFGKTHERVEFGDDNPETCNMGCVLFLVACHFGPVSCLYLALERSRIRRKFGIQGSFGKDFCASCCCTCNVLYQNEQEAHIRVHGVDMKTGQPWKDKKHPQQQQYQSPQGMRMEPLSTREQLQERSYIEQFQPGPQGQPYQMQSRGPPPPLYSAT